MPEPSLYFQRMIERYGDYADRIADSGDPAGFSSPAEDSIRLLRALIDEVNDSLRTGVAGQSVRDRMFEAAGGELRDPNVAPLERGPLEQRVRRTAQAMVEGLQCALQDTEARNQGQVLGPVDVSGAYREAEHRESALLKHVSPYRQKWAPWAERFLTQVRSSSGGDSDIGILSDAVRTVRLVECIRRAAGYDHADRALPEDFGQPSWAAGLMRELRRGLDRWGRELRAPELAETLIGPPPGPPFEPGL